MTVASRSLAILAASIVLWGTSFAASNEAKPLHIVFDIDDTFAFSTNDMPASDSVIVVRVGDRDYSVPKAFLRGIETLLKMDENGTPIRVSF